MSNSLSSKPIRVAHVVSHPIQYYVHLYRAISTLPGVELTVFYLSDQGLDGYFDADFQKQIRWDVDLLGGYRSVFLESGKGGKKKSGLFRKPDWQFLKRLARDRYDVIWAHGYQDSNILGAKLITLLQRKAFLVREDTTLLEPRSRKVLALKRLMFGLVFCGSKSGGLFTGTNSRAHFRHFGVKEDRLFPALHCVDDIAFARSARVLKPERQRIRQSFGITDDAPVVLFCGKLIELKQPFRLVEAFTRVAAKHPCWLLLAGDGPLFAEVKTLCDTLGVADRVVRPGFLNQSQLPRAYAAADLFVLPSRTETWGLVVNEAMHFSLPVIVSDHVGCAPDLVKDGVNGFIVPVMNTEKLSEAMEKLLVDAGLRAAFGAQSATLIQDYTVENCAQQIRYACQALSVNSK